MSTDSPLKTLDATRQRLFQLSNALLGLRNELERNALPPAQTSLLPALSLITHELTALSTHLVTNADLLESTQAFPLPTFPRAQEGLLGQLLRKKRDPAVEGWVGDGAAAAAAAGTDTSMNEGEGNERRGGLPDLWSWAADRAGEIAGTVPWGIDFTVEEVRSGVDSVHTGLKRKLNSGDDGDEDDDDDEEDGQDADDRDKMVVDGAEKEGKVDVKEVSVPMMPLEDVLRFMMTGTRAKTGGPVGAVR
ncbi:hypothetical protein MRB53_037002 [Persea americana]|nr:hypothetical protein MRB53_037002 [Persea americana]